MTLTVRLGCRACWQAVTVEVPVTERQVGPGHWHMTIDTTLVRLWREAHLLPWAASA